MPSGEPEGPGLTVFGLPIDFGEYLQLLTCPGLMSLMPLEALEDFGPRPKRSTAAPPMTLEAYAERSKQIGEVRGQISAARERVASVTGKAYRSRVQDWLSADSQTTTSLRTKTRLGPSHPSDEAKWDADSRDYVHNLILHAESEDIAVTWGSFPDFLGGFVARRFDGPQTIRRDRKTAPALVDARELARVTKADVMLVLNFSQSWASTFDVMLHELAHVLLGHLGAMRGAREGRLAIDPFRYPTRAAKEFEAISVNHMVSAVMGKINLKIESSLVPYFRLMASRGETGLVNVLEVFVASEILCAWCGSPPGRSGVSARPGVSPSWPLSGTRST